MSHVFLTGATGNIGQPVLVELLRRGYEVVALVRRPMELAGCRTVVGDLANLSAVATWVSSASAIVHLASPRSDERQSVLAYDIGGTGALLDSWQCGNFVYASSQTVYGIPKPPVTEASPVEALYWYDWGKVCNELQLQVRAQEEGVSGAAVSLRLPLLFGAGSRRHDRQFLLQIYEDCCRGATFLFESEQVLEESGSSFIGEGDAGRAVVDSLSIVESGPFNVAGGFCTWKAMLDVLGRAIGCRIRIDIGKRMPGPSDVRLPHSRSYLDTTRFCCETHFHPEDSLDELIERFVRTERRLVRQES